MSGFQAGDTAAVWGAGLPGLLAAYSATIRGASRGFSIYHIPAQLVRTGLIGPIPINLVDSDPVQQILAYKPGGIIRRAHAVGMAAINANGTMQQDTVMLERVELAARGAGIGRFGVFPEQNNMSLAIVRRSDFTEHPICASVIQGMIVF